LSRDFLVFQKVKLAKKDVEAEDLLNEEDEKQVINEEYLKKKLTMICKVPSKLVAKFHDPSKDVTLGQKLLKLARGARLACKQCKGLKMKHVIHYYHGNGYVEVKLKKDHEGDTLDLNETGQIEIVSQGVCNICRILSNKRQELPSNVFEMSFYKFLEQFFYNQNLIKRRTNNQCNHRIHQDITRVFIVGRTKITFEFYPEQFYSIEMLDMRLICQSREELFGMSEKLKF